MDCQPVPCTIMGADRIRISVGQHRELVSERHPLLLSHFSLPDKAVAQT